LLNNSCWNVYNFHYYVINVNDWINSIGLSNKARLNSFSQIKFTWWLKIDLAVLAVQQDESTES